MTKLIDEIGTKYLTTNFAGEVTRLLSKVDGVDLAGARICKDVMSSILTAAYNGVNIIDSENSERNSFLAENRKRGELQRSLPPKVSLPCPKTVDEIIPLIKSLDKSLVYEIQDGSKLSLSFATIAQAARPEITLSLGGWVPPFLSFINMNLFPTSHRWEEFYVVAGNTFEVKRPSQDGYSSFISEHVAVPTNEGRIAIL